MKLIQQARFALLYRNQRTPTMTEDISGREVVEVVANNSEDSLSQPAVIELNGIHLSSPLPKTAAEAERINRVLDGCFAL